CGRLKCKGCKWTDLRDDAQEQRQSLIERPWLVVIFAPFLLVLGARNVIDELVAGDSRRSFGDVVFLGRPGYFGQSGNDGAYGSSVSPDRQIEIREQVCNLDVVGSFECSFEHRL